jgi:DNA mismatch repair protein MutL
MIGNSVIPRINSLPGSLINQIAAGEVIVRPSSVVKELVENAIDSGASRIEIEINGGGSDKIIVRDSGCGIHPDDLELAILRHTTSKLHTQEDLDSINSLGFRGEALSSIAAVSDFCITSRIAAEEYAMKVVFNPYTTKHELSPAARERGTTVEVFKLFQPVPARRKFLRSDKTEFLHIQEIIKRFILSRFDIDFSFQHNGKPIINCPAIESDYRPRVSAVMGKYFYDNAWRIDSRIENMQLWGWLGSPGTARSQSDRQYLFLNNRIIKDKHINHAIRKVMDEIIADARYPSYILHLFIDPVSVDVNVHPTKQEVRFKNPRNVHDFIYAALNNAIRQELPDQSRLNLEKGNHIPLRTNQFEYQRANINLNDLKAIYSTADEDKTVQALVTPLGSVLAILYENYLLTRYENDVRIVDYNNLRRNYLHANLTKQLTESGVLQRPLLVPVMLTLGESEISKVMSYQPMLDRMGLALIQSGPQTVSIRSIPALLPGIDIPGLLSILIQLLQSKDLKTENIEHRCLSAMLDLVCSNERHHYSLKDVKEDLQLLVNLDLPFANKTYPTIWNTVLETDLKSLINGGDDE